MTSTYTSKQEVKAKRLLIDKWLIEGIGFQKAFRAFYEMWSNGRYRRWSASIELFMEF